MFLRSLARLSGRSNFFPASPSTAGGGSGRSIHTYVFPALAMLMLVTRGDHFGSAFHLPDASWAAFFLAGAYVGSALAFPALCVLAAAVDMAAVTWGGVSSFCMSPAYTFLLPAYGALWLAGRSHGGRLPASASGLLALVLWVTLGALVAELFSSGGFYLFSGRFGAPSLNEFLLREMKYFPTMLATMAFYVGLAALVHLGVAPDRRRWREGRLVRGAGQ